MKNPRTFWLSLHRPYACRHAGACCSSGWPIPIERVRVARAQAVAADETWLRPAPGAPADVAGMVAVGADGHCVFHRAGCAIQAAHGHDALPAACQHFPREVLIDPRGVFVTLSHYCPTAADLLFDHTGPIVIVEGPPAVPGGEAEGLDAREVLPPLLADGILTDLEGYAAWEAHMVAALTADDGSSPEAALATLEEDVCRLQQWRPGRVSLAEQVAMISAQRACPARYGPADAGSGAAAWAHGVMRRFLAARAFASWMAYQAGGVGAVVRGLRLALSHLRAELAAVEPDDRRLTRAQLKEGIRQTDLWQLHLMDRDELMRQAAVRPA